MLNLSSNIKYIKGVGEKRAGLFGSLAIFDVDALIHFFPESMRTGPRQKQSVSLKTVMLFQSRQQ